MCTCAAYYMPFVKFNQLCLLFTVMGRSIVIHDKDGGAARIACADLVPEGNLYETVEFSISQPEGSFR